MEYEDLKAKLSTEKDGYHIPVGGTTTVTVNTNSCDDTKNIKTSRILKNSNSATVSNNGGNSVATVTKTKATVSSPIQENRNSPMNSPSTLLVSQRAPQLMEPTIKTITNDTLTVDSNSNTVATVAYKPKYR